MPQSTLHVRYEDLAHDPRLGRRELLSQPLQSDGGDDRLDYLINELKVRELLAALCFARDSLDRSWLDSSFVGSADPGLALEGVSFSHSRFANPVVRFARGFESGLLNAYFHTCSIDSDGKARSRFGILLAELDCHEGRWRFVNAALQIHTTATFSSNPLETLWNGRLPQQPKATRSVTMSDSRWRFYQVSKEGFGGVRWLLGQSPIAETREAKLKLLMNNLAIRDCFSRYANAYDSSDVARVIDLVVAEDAVQLSRRDDSPTGLLFMTGKDEVREQYRVWNASRRLSFHRVANVIARFLPDQDECWAAAYYNAPIVGHTNEFQSQFGGYFFRFVREADDWRLADRRPNGPNGGGMVVFPFVTPEPGTIGAWDGRSGNLRKT